MNLYWDGAKAVVADLSKPPVVGCLCIDTAYTDDNGRYGMWKCVDDTTNEQWSNMYWNHVPFRAFPNEFKLQLILLGVT